MKTTNSSMVTLISASLALQFPPSPASATVMEFPEDLSGFIVASGNAPIVIDFDDIAAGSDITDQTLAGVSFHAPGAPLIVVRGTDSFTPDYGPEYRLYPTSGDNALSPGGILLGLGPDPAIENDDLELVFDMPVFAFGMDILEQSTNGGNFLHAMVFDTSGSLLFETTILTPPGQNLPGGSHFWGIVSSEPNIYRIELDESDDDNENPDANIGYDSLRFNSASCAIGYQLEWTQVSESASWSPRGAHSLVSFDGSVWLLGGGSGTTHSSDVWWTMDGETWNLATSDAGWPGRGECSGLSHDGKIWIFGGYGNGDSFNDVWYSDDGINWVQATAAAPWSARYGHSVVSFDGEMWLMGGLSGGVRNDVWRSSDGVNWTEVTPSADWQGRQAFGMSAFRDRMWIMSGSVPGGSAFNDVWSSQDGVNWSLETGSPNWPIIGNMKSVVLDQRLWILGGADSSELINDVWSSANGVNWTQDTATYAWDARYLHAAVVHDDQIWIAGGYTAGNTPQNDVWIARVRSDCNLNDVNDAVDIVTGISLDCDQDCTPDECQPDCDTDGVPDICELDGDADGVPDDCDNCPMRYNPEQIESDGDGIGDLCDNCPNVPNPVQEDCDGDGHGDACGCGYSRGDMNDDGMLNGQDLQLFVEALLGQSD